MNACAFKLFERRYFQIFLSEIIRRYTYFSIFWKCPTMFWCSAKFMYAISGNNVCNTVKARDFTDAHSGKIYVNRNHLCAQSLNCYIAHWGNISYSICSVMGISIVVLAPRVHINICWNNHHYIAKLLLKNYDTWSNLSVLI